MLVGGGGSSERPRALEIWWIGISKILEEKGCINGVDGQGAEPILCIRDRYRA